VDIKHINPSTIHPPYSYSHVVASTGGTLVHVAGQTGADMHGEAVSPDFREQATQTFRNVTLALAAAGADWSNVVKLMTYVVAFDAEKMQILREVRAELGWKNAPAATLLGVEALVNPSFLIEVDAVAIVP
jgi:enamine deaminase RidA (YjgF/YER057c/UK114 family)